MLNLAHFCGHSVSMAMLNLLQTCAVEMSIKGHNAVICGQAGTGKSFTLMHIYKHFISIGKNVGLTATTGIACQQFPGYAKPMTIHRYKKKLYWWN